MSAMWGQDGMCGMRGQRGQDAWQERHQGADLLRCAASVYMCIHEHMQVQGGGGGRGGGAHG